MNMTYYYLVPVLIVLVNYSLQTENLPESARGKCVPIVFFSECQGAADKPIIFYNTLRYQLEVTIIKGCISADITNYWSLWNIGKETPVNAFPARLNKATVGFMKYQLEPGNYILTSHITESSSYQNAKVKAKCYIKMLADCPVPALHGGSVRSAPVGENLKLRAFAITCNLRVLYSWKCKSRTPYGACKRLNQKTGVHVFLPIRGRIGDKIKITLTARSPMAKLRKFVQTILITEQNSPQVGIICLKNCITAGSIYSNPVAPIYLTGKCTSNCRLVKRYKWSIEPITPTIETAEAIIANGTHTGVDSKHLIIKANWFHYEERYHICLNAYDNQKIIARTMIIISMAKDVAGKSECTYRHNSRKGFQRIYIIMCKVPKAFRPVKFMLHQIYKEFGTNRTSSHIVAISHAPRFSVRLAPQSDTVLQGLRLIVLDDTMVTTNISFYVKIARPFKNTSDDELIATMRLVYLGLLDTESISDLLHLGRVQEAAQITNILLREAHRIYEKNPKIRKIIRACQIEIMTNFLTCELTLLDYDYVLAVIPHLELENPKEIRHSKLRSRLCKMVANNIRSYIFHEEYPLCHQGFLEIWTVPLHMCANVYLDDEYERYTSFNISLPDPIPEQIGRVEDYPNYGEGIDDTTAEDLREITTNAISTINFVSVAYAKTFTIGEPRIYINFTANTTIDVVLAENGNKRQYDDGKVHVILPNSLGFKQNELVRVVYTTIPASAFFWEKRTGNISDTVINVNMHGPRKRHPSPYAKHTRFFFKLNKKQRITVLQGEFNVSLKSTMWTDDYVEKNMKCFRIELPQLDNLMTLIARIEPVTTLMVAITKFRKPTKEDFTFETNPAHLFHIVFNKSETDSLFYVAFLPSQRELQTFVGRTKRSNNGPDYDVQFNHDYTASLNTLEEETLHITFAYAFTAMSCREWAGAMWVAENCDIGTKGDATTMHCNCKNASSIVADMKNVKITEERALKIEYTLSITINPIIPMITAMMFGLYCLLICLIYYRKKPLNMYFLCDNLEDDRFAYLIRVYTGAYSHSSTTSNVTIKLNGEKANSKPHVLNQPDPDRVILQEGGEDYFILTTRYYLGEIREMELWYDGYGSHFTWYCEHVNVYDMQTRDNWFFRVCQRFTVLLDNEHHHTFEPSTEIGWTAKIRVYNYFRFYWSPDHLWSIFNRREDSVLSYFERINILLCHVLTTSAIALAVVARPSFMLKDGLSENKFDCCLYIFSNSVGIGVLIFCLYTPLTIVFRYTPKKKVYFMEQKPLLSHKIHCLCWIIIAIVISFCIAYIFYFGFWVSYNASLMWMTIASLAVILDITLLEHLKLSLYKWVIGWRIHKTPTDYHLKFKEIIAEAERQRKFLYGVLGRYALRPILKHLYKPLADEKYVEVHRQKTVECEIGRSASDMAFFYVYACLLFLLLILRINLMTFVSSKHMIDMTVKGSMHVKPGAHQVKTLEDIYDYLNNTLAAVLHPMEWYGRWKVSESGLLADYNTKIIGVARLRQKRVKEIKCPIPFFARLLNITTCHGEYARWYSDQNDAGLSKSIWSFQDVEHSNKHTGEINTYLGTGFIAKLGRNLNNTYYKIKLLKDTNWLGPRTRVVFVEFWTYNANQNLFNAITVIFERSATQLILMSKYVITLELMHTMATDAVFTIIIFTIFCIFIVKLLLSYVRRFMKQGFRMFLTLSNLWEIIVIVMNVTIVTLYLMQFEEHIKVFFMMSDSKSNEFISYFKIMNNYYLIRTITAILFALAIARGIAFMKFISIYQVFEKLLQLALPSFCSVILVSLILNASFGMCAHLLFGGYSENFRNLETSALTLIKGSLGLVKDFSQSIIESYNSKYGYVFFTIYSLSVITMKNIYIVTTIAFYQSSRRAMSRMRHPYTFPNFVTDRWTYFMEHLKRRLLRYRLKGGEDAVRVGHIAIAKHEEFRYEDCVLISDDKLKHMTLIAQATVRKMYFKRDKRSPPTQDDLNLMRNITAALLKTDEDHSSKSMFFKGRDSCGKVKLVSNDKLLEMEYWLNHVLAHSKQMGEYSSDLTDAKSLKKLNEIESVLTSINAFVGNILIKVDSRS